MANSYLVLWIVFGLMVHAQQQQQPYPHLPLDRSQSFIQTNVNTNDTSLLSDIWTSLTTVNKAPSCPGECVHAITSIFCDSVLEEAACSGSMFRCCVQNNQQPNNFQTVSDAVSESTLSPPSSFITTEQPSSQSLLNSGEEFSVISNNHYHSNLTTAKIVPSSGHISASTTTNPPTFTESLHYFSNEFESTRNKTNGRARQPCPVQCSLPMKNSFCSRPALDALCSDPAEQCCLETESSIDTMTKNFIKLIQQTVALNETKNIGSEFVNSEISDSNLADSIPLKTTTTTTTASPLPPCDGTCVVPLFHMLCDEIDTNQYCSHGYCCVNREPVITPAPQISNCGGTCMPVILSGMCNKPFELVLKTIDCGAGTICCAKKRSDENLDNPEDDDATTMNENGSESPSSSFPIPGIIRPLPPMMQNPLGPIHGFPGLIPNPIISIPPRVPLIPPQPPGPYSGSVNPSSGIVSKKPSQQIDSNHYYQLPSNSPVEVSNNNKIHFRPPQPHLNKDQGPLISEKNFKEGFPCPGKCINSLFKFTCLGGHSIFSQFKCSKQQVCCAATAEVEKLEQILQSNVAQQQQQQHMIHVKAQNLPSIPSPPPQPSMPSQFQNNNNNNLPIQSVPINQEVPDQDFFDLSLIKPSTHICGMKNNGKKGRVVGGRDSFPGEWCWQIALVNQQNQYICGGVLIGKQWALTAAHCLTKYVNKNEPVFIRAGEYDLTRSSRLAQTRPVATIYIHHNHKSHSLDNDIALLKLQSPVELNENICLVCLPTKDNSKQTADKRCIVTGYGFQHEDGPLALRIREASVPIVNSQQCMAKISSVTEKSFLLPANSFCAGGEGGNDACQGDGGSGLVCQTEELYYELTGLVSWGFGCGRNEVPGIYVKVSAFVGWINQIVSTNAN